jgi:hypothetical protein
MRRFGEIAAVLVFVSVWAPVGPIRKRVDI